MISKEGQLERGHCFAYGNSLCIEANGDDDKEEEDSILVVRDIEGSGSEDGHYVHESVKK